MERLKTFNVLPLLCFPPNQFFEISFTNLLQKGQEGYGVLPNSAFVGMIPT